MKLDFSHIETDYDINLRFRIDNVQQFFEREGSETGTANLSRRRTATFGPGLQIECRTSTVDGEAVMSCYLYTGPSPYPGPISWSIVGEPLDGGSHYFKYRLTHTYKDDGNTGIGWREVLSKTRHWDQNETLREENAIYITATVQARTGTSACPHKHLELSHKVITTERPCDVQFLAYSARNSLSGKLSGAHTFFADQGTIKKACPQLAKCLKHPTKAIIPGLFGTGVVHVAQDHSNDNKKSTADSDISNVDEECYSDFEDDEVWLPNEPPPEGHVVFGIKDTQTYETHTRTSNAEEIDDTGNNEEDSQGTISAVDDTSEWIFDEPTALNGGTGDDVNNAMNAPPDFQGTSSEGVIGMGDAMTSSIHTPDGDETTPEQEAAVLPDTTDTAGAAGTYYATQSPLEPTMPIITVTGAASSTWEAFLFYLYTGVVTFAPLRSRGEVARNEFITRHKEKNPGRPAPCSSKSMYRLACKLDLAELQALALKDLASQISKDNVVAEIFTEFTSKYEEVKGVELRVLKEHWEELKGTPQMSEVVQRIVRGDLPHVADLMAAIW